MASPGVHPLLHCSRKSLQLLRLTTVSILLPATSVCNPTPDNACVPGCAGGLSVSPRCSHTFPLLPLFSVIAHPTSVARIPRASLGWRMVVYRIPHCQVLCLQLQICHFRVTWLWCAMSATPFLLFPPWPHRAASVPCR